MKRWVVLCLLMIACGGGSGQVPSVHDNRIVCFGTSLSEQGFAPLLQMHEEELGAIVYNEGHGSHNSQTLLDHLPEALDLNPDMVLVETAINDSFYELTHEQVRLYVTEMVRAFQAGGATVYLMTTNPALEEIHPDLEGYYQLYRDLAVELGVVLIDLRPLWDGQDLAVMIPDGTHPTLEALGVVCWHEISNTLEGGRE